jgi:hypothetical protein
MNLADSIRSVEAGRPARMQFSNCHEKKEKRQTAWFDKTIYQLRKVEFFDHREEIFEVMNIEDSRKYKDK